MEQLKASPRGSTASKREGPAALVAAGMCPPGNECVTGELVWVSDLCDDRPCQCEWGFNGAASDGVAMAAEARRFPGIARSTLRRVLVAGMVPRGYPPTVARARVDALLDIAAAHPEGTLFRLENGTPIAFPPGSRIVGPHRIEVPPTGTQR